MHLEGVDIKDLRDRIIQIEKYLQKYAISLEQRKWPEQEKELWQGKIEEIRKQGYSLLN